MLLAQDVIGSHHQALAAIGQCRLRSFGEIPLQPKKQGVKSALRPVFVGKNEAKLLVENRVATTTAERGLCKLLRYSYFQ